MKIFYWSFADEVNTLVLSVGRFFAAAVSTATHTDKVFFFYEHFAVFHHSGRPIINTRSPHFYEYRSNLIGTRFDRTCIVTLKQIKQQGGSYVHETVYSSPRRSNYADRPTRESHTVLSLEFRRFDRPSIRYTLHIVYSSFLALVVLFVLCAFLDRRRSFDLQIAATRTLNPLAIHRV